MSDSAMRERERDQKFEEWCRPDPTWEYEPGFRRCWNAAWQAAQLTPEQIEELARRIVNLDSLRWPRSRNAYCKLVAGVLREYLGGRTK